VSTIQHFWANLTLGQVQPLGMWAYLLLALTVVVEGPIATLLGASAAAMGLLRPGLVFVSAAIGNISGDMLWYLMGWIGKTDWLLRHAHWLGLRESHIQRFRREIQIHAGKVLFVAKLTMSFSIPALIAAGLARVSWRRVLGAIVPAECIWTGSLVLVGYYFSRSIRRLEQGVQIVAILGAFVAIVLAARTLRRHHGPSAGPEEQ